MSENKFIARLKGEPTPKSVVEIQNDKLVAPFKSSPRGYIADRDSSVVVAKGAQNWAVNQGQLVPVADDYIGTESDLSGTSRVSGAGLWVNATYTFPASGDDNNPVSAIIAPNAKWVLTLCGDNLITKNGSVIALTLLVKIGATHLTTKQFKVRECASQFSQRLAIDFSESEQAVIKAHGGSPLTVQVLCDDEGASATIYGGMTHLTLLQRKIDADLVAADNVLLPEFIENLLEGYIIPEDYFSRYEYIEQVEDGAKAMPEFTRAGDEMHFSGWAKPATEVYTKTEIDDKFTVANAQIDANADAIQKTRDDMNEEDGRLQTQITAHAGAITALQNEQTQTGNQIQNIESKIPDGTSDTNPLINKQQLLDEEMDIREDLNEGLSELQTQITHQAVKISDLDNSKLDKNQGAINAGRVMVVGDDGIVAPRASGSDVGLTIVSHDSSLSGAGTDASPLRIADAVRQEIADKADGTVVETMSGVVSENTTKINTLRTDLDDLDDDVSEKVNKSGDTMTGNLGMNDGGVIFKDTQTAVAPSADAWHKGMVQFLDKNNVRVGWIQPFFKTDGTMELRIVSCDPVNGNKYLNLGSNGNLFWNGEPVITTAGGTFTSNIAIQKETPQINLKSTVMDITSGGWAAGRNTVAWCMDKNGYESAGVYNTTDTGGTARMAMYVMSRKSGSQVQAFLGVGVNSSGQAYATAPNTPDGAGTNEVVTAKWAKDKFVRIVAKQDPTSKNSYTWYRKYADGWVEQGGRFNRAGASTVNMPIEMADVYAYNLQLTSVDRYQYASSSTRTTTSFTVTTGDDSASNNDAVVNWYVCGYAAS